MDEDTTSIGVQLGRLPEDRQKLLEEWYTKAEELRKLRATEILLRKAVVEIYLGEPTEGTNRVDIGGGYDLVVQQPYTRDIDEVILQTLRDSDDWQEAGIPVDDLVKYKPSLVKKEYNKLNEDQLSHFNECVTTKPGSPSVKVELSKEAKKALQEAKEKGLDIVVPEPDDDTDDIPF